MSINNIAHHIYGPFPVIELGDILLREIESSDASAYFNYMSREVMSDFLTEDNMPKNFEEAAKELEYWANLFKNKRSFYWAIALKESNKMIGTAGFNILSPKHSKAEISYDLDYDHWGRGYMLKSIKAIIRFAEEALGISRIQATVIIDNERSIKILERCGFSKEGILKKFEVIKGQHKDYYMYARTH